MACNIGCKKCDVMDGNYIISNYSPPQNANPGTIVSIPIVIKQNCVLCSNLGQSITVCLHDTNGQCIASTTPFTFYPWGIYGSTQNLTLSYTQPTNSDFNGTLSVVQLGVVFNDCVDSKVISVQTNFPPGSKKYSCSAGSCVENSSGKYSSPDCNNECSTAGKVCDPITYPPSDYFCIFGNPIKKNDAYMLGGGIVLLMMLSRS